MQASWAPESLDGARLAQVFAGLGEQRELDGSHPRLVDDAESVWYVQAGAVDLFLVEVVDGEPHGRRWPFLRVETGGLIFGIPHRRTPMGGLVGLLAVGVNRSKVSELDQESLRMAARKTACTEALQTLVDDWVWKVSERLPREEVPRDCLVLQAGQESSIEPGQLATAAQKTMWVHVRTGRCRFVGSVEIAAPERRNFFPLTRVTWIEATEPLTYVSLEGSKVFAEDPDWESLNYFHKLVIFCLVRARELELNRERGLFLARAAGSEARLERALATLGMVEAVAFDARETNEDRGELLFRAWQALAKAEDLPARAPPGGVERTLESIARASGVRLREIVLEEGWWRRSGEPMMGTWAANDSPIALIPINRKGYAVFDPISALSRPIDSALGAKISPVAQSLYRPFPPRKVRAADVLRFILAGNKYDLGVILLAGLVLGILGSVAPFAFGEMIDSFIPDAQIPLIFQMGAGLAAVAFATLVAQVGRGTATLRIEARAATGLQSAVWDRLLGLPVSFFRQFGAGDLAMRAEGIEQIRRALSGSTLNGLLSSIFSITSVALLFYYDMQLTWVALGLALTGAALATLIGYLSVRLQRQQEEIDGLLSSMVLEMLSGITKLRLAGAEDRAFARWANRFSERRDLEVRILGLQNLFGLMDVFFPPFCSVVIFWLVSQRPEGSLSTGQFLGFNAAFTVFLMGVLQLVNIIIEQIDLLPRWERARPIFEAIPEVDEVKAHPGELQGQIRVNALCFRYSEDTPQILDDVEFTIEKGEFVAIVGGSGAGKSTLLRVLLGFEKPSSGGVYYDGQDLGQLDVTEVRRQIGVVLQNGELIGGSIFSNIVGSRNLTLEDAWAAAKMAGVEPDIRDMPMQMHTVISHGGKSLSGGQQQRIQIARALVARPRVLFFDEATSALDEHTQKVVSESLEALRATRVVIAHRLSTVRNADRIIVLDKGRVAQSGTYDELMARDGLFRELASRQIA